MNVSKKNEPDVTDDPIAEVEQDRAYFDDAASAQAAESVEEKPKPGDADYDWTVVYGTDTNGKPNPTYRHTLPDGKIIEIPKFRFPGGSIFRRLRNVPEWDQPRVMLDMCLDTCPAAADLIDAVPVRWDDDTDFITDLYAAWINDATKPDDDGEGLTPGE